MKTHDTAFEAFMLAMHENGTSGLAMRKNLKIYMNALLDSPDMVERVVVSDSDGTVAKGYTTWATWKDICPLRFIVRDGKKILQSPHQCLETLEIEWRDVPLMEEV
jgi:hypothetical protein